MVNFGPLTAEIGCRQIYRVSRLGFVTAPTSLNRGQSTTLCTIFGRLLGWYNICAFLGLLYPKGIVQVQSKFTLRPRLAFFYIGSATARHLSSGCQPNFVAFSRGRHLYYAGRPSRWVSAYTLVGLLFYIVHHKVFIHLSQCRCKC